MGTTRLEGDKLRSLLAKTINPFGIVKDFAVGSIRGVVTINGREEVFEIEALEIQAIPITETHPAGTRSEPAGRGKIKLATVDGVAR